MEVIGELRLEMKALMENQLKEYEILRNRFINTETELKELRKEMKVLQGKVDKVQILEAKVDSIVRNDEKLVSNMIRVSPTTDKNEEAYLQKGTPQSFAAAANRNQNRVLKNKFPTKQASVATKPSDKSTSVISSIVKEIPEPKQVRNNSEQITETEDIESQKEGNWIIVNKKKKSRYPNTEASIKRHRTAGKKYIILKKLGHAASIAYGIENEQQALHKIQQQENVSIEP
ncbi:unnamed protein product [Parnassius apollo]|uniref:(apollo) hypothetical protein n=1 Tax=Parnassius apollo TaxID=110799 RepID=A0A8S3WR70_PARAO|nr:unnamed protein product [Parnassius apollo]